MKNKIYNPNKMIFVGIILLLVIISSCILAQVITHEDPYLGQVEERFIQPNLDHFFGTDNMGRDIFTRVLYGGRWTLTASFITMVITLALGIFLGIICGYYEGKWFDILILRIMDSLMGFPFMILAMIIAAFFGTGLFHLLSAVILVKWIPFARLSRSIVLKGKHEVKVLAAKVSGASDIKIIFDELLPQIWISCFVLATFELGELILSISALSFFGLGAKPPLPEWGSMLADSKSYFFRAPYLVMGPSIYILLTVLGLNLIGEGLRDKLTPYEKIKL